MSELAGDSCFTKKREISQLYHGENLLHLVSWQCSFFTRPTRLFVFWYC